MLLRPSSRSRPPAEMGVDVQEQSRQMRAAPNAYGTLMQQAAGVLRRRYVQCGHDGKLSPAEKEPEKPADGAPGAGGTEPSGEKR